MTDVSTIPSSAASDFPAAVDNPRHVRAIWKLLAFAGLALVAHLLAFVPAVVAAKVTRLVGAAQFYPAFTALGLLAASWLTLRMFDRQPIGAIGIGPGRRWLLHATLGLVFGAVLFALVWAVLRFGGFATTVWREGASGQWSSLFVAGLFSLSVAAYEEILFRGYAFQVLARWNRPAAAVIVGLGFVAIHLPNEGGTAPLAILNVFLAHLLCVAVFLRTRSLWWPIGLHAAWNFVEAFIFGMPVSGARPSFSVLITHMQGNLWTGGAFGPESGVVTTLVLIAGTVAAWRWIRQHHPAPDLLAMPRSRALSTESTRPAGEAQRAGVGIGPVPPSKRIQAIDVLRGAAILGILPMNMQLMAMIDGAYLSPYAGSYTDSLNVGIWVALQVVIGHKDLSVFSMLFGAGILLMSARRSDSGPYTTSLHYARMAVLLVFGMLHAYLIWSGDILVTYAICGALVFPLRNLKPGILVAIGSAAYAFPMILLIAAQLMLPLLGEDARATVHAILQPTPELIAEHNATFGASWLEQMPARAGAALGLQTGLFLLGLLWVCGGMMCVGMAFHKWGIYAGRLSDRTYLVMAAVGGAVGMALIVFGLWRNFASGWSPDTALLGGRVPTELAAPIVAVAWTGVIMLICRHGLLPWITRPLAAVGRMALSNYLAHSVICSFIFYGHGLGLVGKVDRAEQLPMTVLIWAATMIWSVLWLSRFYFGPFEWLWRTLSHGQRQRLVMGGVAEGPALAK